MDPALLKALQKGGGKPPSKVKGKAKKKAPPRPKNQPIERSNPNAGRVVGAGYKPKPNSGSAPSPPRAAPRGGGGNPLHDAIMAKRANLNSVGGSKSKSKSKAKPKPKP